MAGDKKEDKSALMSKLKIETENAFRGMAGVKVEIVTMPAQENREGHQESQASTGDNGSRTEELANQTEEEMKGVNGVKVETVKLTPAQIKQMGFER